MALAQKKGPAEAATSLPSRSSQSLSGKSNMDTNSTALPNGASERDPLAPRGPMTLTIDMAALRRLSMKEIRDFRSVMHTLSDVLCGLNCQPRFAEGDLYNEAGEILDTIIDFINGYEQAAVNVARAAMPASPHDIEWRAWTVIGFEADMADELAPLAVAATEALRDVQAHVREERRAA